MRLLRRILFWFYTLLGLEAVRLNLRVDRQITLKTKMADWLDYALRWHLLGVGMSKIGDTFTASIRPTNAAGASAPVFSSVFTASGGYDFSVATDGLSATFVAKTSGTGFSVTATAISKSGATLTDTKPLPDVEFPAVDDEAVALNLAVA